MSNHAFSQTNSDISEKSFFEIQKESNAYWDAKNVENGYYFENGEKVKAAGWKQFKRWEYYWENRIDPQTGAFPKIGRAEIYQKLQQWNSTRSVSGNWQSLGPSTSPGGYAGLGRINVVGFHPSDNNILYAGSPSGGLWKTTDGGSNWTVLTDNNAVLGVSDVVVIAGGTTDSDVVYIATGDRDGGSMWSLGGDQGNDNNSVGVLKSTDGGSTWSTTPITFTTNQKRRTNRLLKHPSNDNMIYASASDGKVYQTTDGGLTWPSIFSGIEFVSMEFKPGDPTIMYGSTRAGKIYRSTNSGSNWTEVLAVSGALRVQLAVTADDDTYVYAVVANSVRGLEGVYLSTNSGATFTKVFDGSVSGNNIMGSSCDGTVTGGQGTYDICIAADPTNANTLFVGGINTWKSVDGGSSWTINTIWALGNYPSCVAVETHADKHFLGFQNGSSTLFEGNDGGVNKTTDYGTNWSFISNGMYISQLYRLGVSQTSSSSVIAGLQDNGTKSKLGSTWTDVIGGDGMECAIDPTTSSTQYGEYQNGNIFRTSNTWSSKSAITRDPSTGAAINGLDETGYWVTPFSIDQITNTTLYLGLNNVWKSADQGDAWIKISTWGTSNKIRSLTAASSNSDYIYAATQTKIYVTTDGGSNWANSTGTLPVGSSYITYISVKSDDPQTAWVSFGEYNQYGVYETLDGGSTWADISTGLPNVPVMCVIQNKQNTAANELYAATDLGVYVKVGNGGWTAFNTGLPNVVVAELEIYYNTGSPNLSRLRAATFGRGLWESELYSASTTAPITDFEADDVAPALGQTVNFTDLTVNDPTYYHWSFSTGDVTYLNGTSEASEEPIVKFTATGTYEVSLYTENANGNDTEIKLNYITVSAPTYCSASGGGFGSISSVQLGAINNPTGSSGYGDYTAQSTNLSLSSTNSIIVTNSSGDGLINLSIWIDWNQDGDFTDTDEEILCGIDNGGAGTFTINVPTTASLGSTRMRLRSDYWATSCSSCGSTANGEVEDYTVNITGSAITWTGNVDTDWATAGNWSGNAVPTASNNVQILLSTPVPYISSSTTAEVNNLATEGTSYVTIAGHLNINGSFIMNNKTSNSNIVIESTVSGTGSLITNTNGINATVQRYITGGKWHLIGAPASPATVNNLYFSGSPEVWIKSYTESDNTWTYIQDINTTMSYGQGFSTWVETGNNATASFEGTINANDLTLNTGTTPALAWTDASHGFNLVANPFPNPIDWDQGGWTRTNISASVWVYKDGAYVSRNGNGQGSLTDGIIPVGQGFFIQTLTAAPSLTIPKNARVQSSQAYRSSDKSLYEGPPYVVMDVFYENLKDEVWMTFSEDFSSDYDEGWDVNKRFGDGNAPQLYVFDNNMELSISALSNIGTEGLHIPLYFEARQLGQYNLMLHEQMLLDDVDILLEDTYLNVIQDLHQSASYNFSAASSDDPERFIMHFNTKLVGIEDGAKEELIHVYAWNKAIYIKSDELISKQNVQIQIYDLYGRELNNRKVNELMMVKIPVNVDNTYLIVKVVSDSSIIVKKVIVQ